ncbi:hypothetical protein INT46_001237, partial [Mucor plumbeus]
MSPHNEWTILEKLLLTQAVYKYGENMWFQVARVIKQHDLVQLQNIERSPDFYSQKNCSYQYYLLVENLQAESQALRHDIKNDMPVVVRLARHLYLQRVEEIKNRLVQDQQEYNQLAAEIHSIKSGEWDHKFKADSPAVKNSDSMATDLDSSSNTVAKQPESTPIISDIEDNSGTNDAKENAAISPEKMSSVQLDEKKYSIENKNFDSKLILQDNRLKRTSSDATAQESHLLKRSRLSELSQEEQVLSTAISDTHTDVVDKGLIVEKTVVDTINQEKPTDTGLNYGSNPVSEIDYNTQMDIQHRTLLNQPIVNDAMETDVQPHSPKFMEKEST